MIMVAARGHPLAMLKRCHPKGGPRQNHVQLVLTDRSELTVGREFGVMSPLTWRLGDLYAKHAFLLKGLGWGGMPAHAVKQDLQQGRLAKLSIEDLPDEGLVLHRCSRSTSQPNHQVPRAVGLSSASANVLVNILPMRTPVNRAHRNLRLASTGNNCHSVLSPPDVPGSLAPPYI